MVVADEAFLHTARQYKEELMAQMFGITPQVVAATTEATISMLPMGANIVGIGYGARATIGSGYETDIAVRVYVRTKLPLSQLSIGEIVPANVNGLPTDVVPVGDVSALARNISCGVSIGHYKTTAGTLGCLVKPYKENIGDIYILSNNHVLANANDAVIGDKILEPGPMDGGTIAEPIAELFDFEPLKEGGEINIMDAAIARLLKSGEVTPDIRQIGNVQPGIMPSAMYQSVRKWGRTTLHTVGVVMGLSEDIKVHYGTKVVCFEDQLAIVGAGGIFSDGGDSGSLIVDAVTCRPVALLFSGGRGTSFANPIVPILDRFKVEIL